MSHGFSKLDPSGMVCELFISTPTSQTSTSTRYGIPIGLLLNRLQLLPLFNHLTVQCFNFMPKEVTVTAGKYWSGILIGGYKWFIFRFIFVQNVWIVSVLCINVFLVPIISTEVEGCSKYCEIFYYFYVFKRWLVILQKRPNWTF